MDERSLKSWWRRWLPDLSAAASRFPLAVLIAGLLTLYRLGHDLARDVDLRILGALVASFLWVVAVDFYVESGARSFATRVVLWIAGIAAIVVLFYFCWEIWLSPHLLLGSLAHSRRSVGPSRPRANPTRPSGCSITGFGSAPLLALVGAVLFAAGLSAIFETLNILFAHQPALRIGRSTC